MSSYYKQHKPGGSDDLYLRLKDGDKVRLRIASECAVTTYDGKKLRYNWVVWNRDLKKPQVYSSGVSVYTQIADLIEDWGEPTEFDITIKRTGSGQLDTSYTVNPTPKSEALTKAESEEAEKVDLLKAVPKSRWLADYVEDGEMPETIEISAPVAPQESSDKELDSVWSDGGEPISLSDIPI